MNDQFSPPEMVEVLQQKVNELETKLESEEHTRHMLIDQHEATLNNAREQHTRTVGRQHDEHRATVARYDERVTALTATEQGEAIKRMEEAEAKTEQARDMVTQYRGRVEQAESEARRAWASVDGSGPLEASDPRLLHLWEKAHRIATSEGFCQEYDKIAEGLGVPDIEIDYSGEVTVTFSGSVTIPVSGRANRRDIADGEIEPDIDTSDIIENVNSYDFDYEVESYDISAD